MCACRTHPWSVDSEYLAALQAVPEHLAKVRHCSTTNTDIEISYQTFGSPADPCVLLVMGLNGTGHLWDLDFCRMLVAKGFFVVRYDHRDVGLSTKLDKAGSPSILRQLLPQQFRGQVPYLLVDMALDGMALLDHLKIDKAHVVGVSMGGMLAQTIAIEFPHRVLTMTSMYSSTGGPRMVGPSWSLKRFMARGPKSQSVHDLSAFRVEFVRRAGGPRAFDEDKVYTRGVHIAQRSTYIEGVFRHVGAIVCSPSRVEGLGRLKMPCLVIHGDKDELVPTENGYQTHKAIPGSRLVIVPDMGHVIFEEDYELIADEIARLAASVGTATAS